MNEYKFFEKVRDLTGPLSKVQVEVINEIIRLGGHLSAEHMAYILATGWGEAKLKPQRENMKYSAARIKKVWPNRPEAVKFAGKPVELANSVYGGRLGNRLGTNDGWDYRGGGVDQLTGRDNYAKVGLVGNPEAILDPMNAAKSIVNGMTTGRYTGKKLSSYGDGSSFNPVAARAIVNGDVALNGKTYTGYYEAFLTALRSAGWTKGNAPVVDYVINDTPNKKPSGAPSAGGVAAMTGLAVMVAAVWQWWSDIFERITAWLN